MYPSLRPRLFAASPPVCTIIVDIDILPKDQPLPIIILQRYRLSSNFMRSWSALCRVRAVLRLFSSEMAKPRCFFDVKADGKSLGRVVFEVQYFMTILSQSNLKSVFSLEVTINRFNKNLPALKVCFILSNFDLSASS